MAEKNSLWKNIRNKGEQNRKTGATPKKPTTEMIRQERKIKAKKADGGLVGEDDKNKTTTARDNTTVTSKSLEEKMAGAVNSANIKAQEQKEKAALEQERVKLRKFLDSSTGSLQNWKDRENAMQRLLEIDNQLGTRSLEEEVKTLNKAGRIMLKGAKYFAPEIAPVIDAVETWGDIYQYSKDPSLQNAISLGLDGMSPIKVVTNAGRSYRPFGVLDDIYDVNNIINEKAEGGYYAQGSFVEGEDDKKKPIYTPYPNDPRIKMYNDSLNLSNRVYEYIPDFNADKDIISHEQAGFDKPTNSKNVPIGVAYDKKGSVDQDRYVSVHKKPVQPYVYKKPAAINRGANSGYDANGKPLINEVNYGDNTGWHKIQATGGYTNPYNQYQDDPYLQYANGGYMYGNGGRTWKNIGAGAYGALEGLVDTTFGWIPGVDMVTDMGYKALQKAGNSTADEIREQDSIHGYSQTAGAVTSAILTAGATTGSAISEGAEGLGQGISKGNESEKWARDVGTGLNIAGTVVGTAYNVSDAGKASKEAFKLSKAGSEGLGKFAAAAPKSAAAIKAANDTAAAAKLATTVDSAGNVIGATETTIKGVDAAGNALSMKPGVLAPPIPSAPSASSLAPNLPATAATTASASLPTSLPSTSDYSKLSKIGDVASSLSALPKSQEPPPMAPPIAPTPLPKEQPQTNYNEFTINPPAVNTEFGNADINFGYDPTQALYSQGGNITNNSLNLRNTMRYKRFAQGGTFDQYGINMIPDSAGLHHESAYGGVPIGPNALAEGGEVKMDIGDGNQYIVSDQVDGAETQKDFMFSKGGKYKELNRTLADGMKQDLNKYTFGSLATSDRVKGDLRRPNDSYGQSTVEQIKQKWQQKTEYARQRTQQDQAIAQAEEQKKMAEEQYIAAYGGRINPKKYPGLNMTKKAKGGYVYNPMTQPMYAQGGPIYGNPASEYTYARGGQIDYTNDMYAGGGPMVSNVNQPFNGPSAQNRGGMYIYPDGGMMPPQEQQMMQEQQMQQQAPQEEMQQQPDQEQMMQMVQQAAQMLEQGAQPEQVMQQLVQAGVPQDMAMQAVQMAMQEMQGQMQQEQPMQGQEQMMPPQGMANGGIMYYGGGNTGPGKAKPKPKPPEKVYYTDRAAFDKHYAGYVDTMDTGTNILAIERALAAQQFASQQDFKKQMQAKYDKAYANKTVNPKLLTHTAPVQVITHKDKSKTNYTKGTSPAPRTEPVFRPEPLEELKPLKLTNIPIEEAPLELNLSNTTYKAPPQVNRVTVREAGNIKKYNDDKHYKDSPEVYMDDTLGNRKVSPAELEEILKKYPGADSDEGWTRPAKERTPQATGGMMPPQDGMASQVAQQLQQGAQPQQVLQKLVEQGMPQEQAMAMVQAVMGQLKNQMQQPQQQQPMMARGGYFNGRKQYSGEDTSKPPVFSPLADESTMSQIAGIGQSVIPALTSAYALKELSKRKLTPSLVENVNIDYAPERSNMMEENRRNLSSGINAMRNVAPTSGSYMGNVRETVLNANKLSGEQISKSWQDQKNEQAKYDYQTGATNAGIKNKINESNEEMYQNAMQTGFEAAGNSAKNLASYYADREGRNLQRWQAQNTVSENKYWTPKGLAHRDPKTGKYYINQIEVDLITGMPPAATK